MNSATALLPQPHQARPKLTGIGSPRFSILLVLAALIHGSFVFIPNVVGAQLLPRDCISRGCPERAPENGELVGTYGPGRNKQHVRFFGVPTTNKVPFGGTFSFYYGISRPHNRAPGAIAVRVVRNLVKPQPGNDWLTQTQLYRNEFDAPTARKSFDDKIDRKRYARWHDGQFTISDRLNNEFHIEFRKGEHTSKPLSRRRSFVFANDGDVLQRAYILGYQGVRPDGTWIYFTVDLTPAYTEAHITIVDLGLEAHGDPVQWQWHLENSAN